MSYILVLNDGETYTPLQGCTVVEVIGDGEIVEPDLKEVTDPRRPVGIGFSQDDGTVLRLVKRIDDPSDVGLE